MLDGFAARIDEGPLQSVCRSAPSPDAEGPFLTDNGETAAVPGGRRLGGGIGVGQTGRGSVRYGSWAAYRVRPSTIAPNIPAPMSAGTMYRPSNSGPHVLNEPNASLPRYPPRKAAAVTGSQWNARVSPMIWVIPAITSAATRRI